MNPTTYKNPLEAQNALTSSFNPTNDAQRRAIANASALVPTVNSTQLAPATPITPVTAPKQIITTPAFDLTPQETEAEQGVRTGMSDISSLLGDLSGENTYRAEQSANQDLIGKKSAITSYQNQLKTLQSQGQGIQLQLQQDFQNLQNQAQQGGANVTKGGLDPQRRALQTQSNQQLLSNAIQQYSVGAQLSASQGDYATALQYVDQAVSLKYQGKKDQLAAAQANLELLLNSPDLTSAQEKRALQTQKRLDEEKRKIEREEKDYETIQGLALQAQQNGAPSVIVSRLANAKDFATALEVGAGYLSTETDSEIKRYNKATSTGFKGSFLDYQKELERAKLLGKAPANVASNLPGIVGANGKYKSDLDALIGNTYNIIGSKFGQESFGRSISSARTEADKINAVATVALANAPAEVKNDFAKQSQGVKSVEKALSLLDEGLKTNALKAGLQYTYNVAGADFDPQLAKLNAYITSAIQPYRSSITGAAWGDQEDAEYQNLFGSIKYTPEALRTRLETLRDILTSKSSTALYAQIAPLQATSDENPFDQPTQLTSPDGKSYVDVSDLTPAELQEARSAGWK